MTQSFDAGHTSLLEMRRRPRLALYSHDTVGLGHKRRNTLIAQTLGRTSPPKDILMIAGVREGTLPDASDGLDCLTLPALTKKANGQYAARHLSLPLDEFIRLRARTIQAALEAFAPDVLIVDNVPSGADGELLPTLSYMHALGRTRLVLGMRDVLDDPVTVQLQWQYARHEQTIRRYYDAVWVYGDAGVYDTAAEYRFAPDIAAKVRYVGYLDQRKRLEYVTSAGDPLAGLNLPPDPFVLCSVGGGQDGGRLAEAFSQATLPDGVNAVLVTGPFMPPDVRHRVQANGGRNPRLWVLDYVGEPALLIAAAQRVIAMGGYNTTCEVLSFAKPALIVPRVAPRQEQWIRARRLAQLGLVDVLHPDALTPQALTDWLARDVPKPHVFGRVDLDGLRRLPRLVDDLLAPPAAVWNQVLERRMEYAD